MKRKDLILKLSEIGYVTTVFDGFTFIGSGKIQFQSKLDRIGPIYSQRIHEIPFDTCDNILEKDIELTKKLYPMLNL